MNQNCNQTYTDEQLVDFARRGDDSAFAELVRRYRKSFLKLAASILRNDADAEDEVQNACWKAFERLEQFNGEAKFASWLSRIVVNQCLMRLRRAKRTRLLHLNDVTVGEIQATLDLPDPNLTPEQELGRTQVSGVVWREIRRIPPLLRTAFVLREVHELPMETVAARLGVSIAAAKSRLLRARLELRLRLAPHLC